MATTLGEDVDGESKLPAIMDGKFFPVVNRNGQKIVAKCMKIVRKSFFSHRVLDRWNRLPEMVVDADTVQMFKSRYDRFSKYMGN